MKRDVFWRIYAQDEVLRRDTQVYGNLLSYYLMRMDEMPYDFNLPIIKAGVLYDALGYVRERILKAYVDNAAIEADFMLLESYDPERSMDHNKAEGLKVAKEINPVDLSIQRNDIGFCEEYINLKRPKNWLRVLVLTEGDDPIDPDDRLVHPKYDPDGHYTDRLLGILNEPLYEDYEERDILYESVTKLIVVDPLLFANLDDGAKALKQVLDKKADREILFHASQFPGYLKIEREAFDEKWQNLRQEIIRDLKRRHKVLTLHNESWRIRKAQDELKNAVDDIRRGDSENCMRRVGLACESLVQVAYHFYKFEPSGGKAFSDLLTQLKDDVARDYGEDTYNDLDFIRNIRNTAVHPNPTEKTFQDALKMIKRAELFQELLISRIRNAL